MRRVFILIVLSGLMLVLGEFSSPSLEAVEDAVHPKSLAAFGFLLLAAFTIGEMVTFIQFPRVVGFLIAGILFGPFSPIEGLRFFSYRIASELSNINDLAIGLIALMAGGELRVKQLKKDIKAILLIIVSQLVIILPVVLLSFGFGYGLFLDSATVPDLTILIALGLLIGTLAVGNSPAISVNIVQDTRSQGPMTNLNLGVTIAKDLVVVVAVAVATAISIQVITSAEPYRPALEKPPVEGTGRLEGQLTLPETYAGEWQRVTVKIGPDEAIQTAQPNAEGRFELRDIPATRQLLRVEHPDLPTHRVPLTITDGETLEIEPLLLGRARSVEGRVVLPEVDDASGTTVTFPGLEPVNVLSDGTFKLQDLPSGRYEISVEHPDFKVLNEPVTLEHNAELVIEAPLELEPRDTIVDAIVHLMVVEIIPSLLFGLALGIFILLYLYFVKKEVIFFLVGLIFVGMLVAKQNHMEAILVFIVAGFIVENMGLLFEPLGDLLERRVWRKRKNVRERRERFDHLLHELHHYGHHMIHEIEKGGLPVFVVFFATAGAKLNLEQIFKVWEIAVLIVAVRAVFMLISTRIGNALAKSPPQVSRNLGLGFFSQAGVSLGLMLIIKARLDQATTFTADGVTYPGIGSDIFEPVVMGIVGINLMFGPVFLKISLTRAKEVDKRADDADEHEESDGHEEAHTEPGPQEEEVPQDDERSKLLELLDPASALRELEFLEPEPGLEEPSVFEIPGGLDPKLIEGLEPISGTLDRAVTLFNARFVEHHRRDQTQALNRMRDTFRQEFSHLPERLASTDNIESQRAILRRTRVHLANAFHEILITEHDPTSDASLKLAKETFTNLIRNVRTRMRNLNHLSVPERVEIYAKANGDSWFRRLRKKRHAAQVKSANASGRPRYRAVNLPQLARFYITTPLTHRLVPIANQAGYLTFFFWRKAMVLSKRIDNLFDLLIELEEEATEPTPEASAEGDDPQEDAETPAEEDAEATPPIVVRLEQLRIEIEEEFDFAHKDVQTFTSELTQRLVLLLQGSMKDLIEACSIAGTFLLPERATNTSRIFELSRKGEREIPFVLEQWNRSSEGYAGILLTFLDLISLRNAITDHIHKTQTDLHAAIGTYLRPRPEIVLDYVHQALQLFDEKLHPEQDLEAAEQLIQRQKERLRKVVARRAIARLEKSRDSDHFNELLMKLVRNLHESCNEVRSSYEVIELDRLALREGARPDAVELHTLPLRELARELIVNEATLGLSGASSLILRAIDMTITGLSEVQRIIIFNLESALTELRQETRAAQDPELELNTTREAPASAPLAREFAVGGLQRAQARLEELLEYIDDTVVVQLTQLIADETLSQYKRLHKLATEARLKDINAFLAQRTTSLIDEEHGTGLRSLIPRARRRVRLFINTRVKPRVDLITSIFKHRLGLVEPTLAPPLEITREASFAAIQNDAIPITYRRLFTASPVTIEEFFIGFVDETEVFVEAWSRFQNNLPSSVLIHGEEGSGKTSFVDHALRKVKSQIRYDVVKRHFTHSVENESQLATNLAELLLGIDVDKEDAGIGGALDRLRSRMRNATTPRRIVVVEGLHNFFLRTLDGFDALRKFLLLVQETSDTFFWIVTINTDSYHYLEHLFTPAHYFSTLIPLVPQEQDSLRAIIEARHHVSGLKLRFSEHTGSSRARRRLPALLPTQRREEMLEEQFFIDLADFSQGNIILALYYWLRALQPVEDEEALDVIPIEPLDTAFINELDPQHLLALGAVITHGGLTLSEYARVSRRSLDDARGILTHLVRLNLIYVEYTHVETYLTNPVMFRPIAEVLRNRFIL